MGDFVDHFSTHNIVMGVVTVAMVIYDLYVWFADIVQQGGPANIKIIW